MPAPRISVFIFALTLATVLVACGKTGPLYLPAELANTPLKQESSEMGLAEPESTEQPIDESATNQTD